MQSGFTTVPFRAESGLSQIDGLGKFSPAGIVLEFESKLFGILKGGVKENRISLDEILDVRFRKGFFKFGTKIEIRLKSFARLAEFPNQDGKITLRIRREDFALAQQAVERLQKDLAEKSEIFSSSHTPVSILFDESEAETKDLK